MAPAEDRQAVLRVDRRAALQADGPEVRRADRQAALLSPVRRTAAQAAAGAAIRRAR